MSNMKALWNQDEEEGPVPVDKPWTNTKDHPETAEARPAVEVQSKGRLPNTRCEDTMFGLQCGLRNGHQLPHTYVPEGRR